jgi:hypothetical protein
MSLLTRRSSHQRFAELLESPSTVATDPALGSMAGLAYALRAAGQATVPAGPDEAFRAALRQRLVAVAAVQAAAPVAEAATAAARVSYRVQRRIAAVASGVALATSVAGVGVAASRSLPGDPFYGVKRATEGVQLWLAQGDAAKGKRHLEFARARLTEARELPTDSSHISSTLAAMDDQTTAGAADLIAAYTSSHSTAPLATLVTFSRQQTRELVRFAKRLPAAARNDDLASIGVVASIVKQVHTVSHGVCVTCAPGNGGSHGGTPKPTPTPDPSNHASQQPPGRSQRSPSAHPSRHASRPAGHGRSATPKPSKSIPVTVPTGILPTIPLSPSKVPNPLRSSLLGGVDH